LLNTPRTYYFILCLWRLNHNEREASGCCDTARRNTDSNDTHNADHTDYTYHAHDTNYTYLNA